MGILAPLYLAGLAALSLPLILHLVRRTPKGKKEFSSLMFLSPSPPRLTRRSRLDQILLLLLRLAILALLAFAFARPFLRQEATLSFNNLPSRRVAILLDTSASMRRADLWQQAIKQVEKELDDLGPQDEVALYTFGDRLQTLVGFERDTSPTREKESAASKPASEGSLLPKVDVVRQQLKTLRPTWSATDLGAALVAVAGELEAAGDVAQSVAEPQLIVVSDFQKGARTEALQAYEWPKRVRLIAREVHPKQTTNAYAHLLTSETEEEGAELRVRVVNSEGSAGDQFFVHWADEKAKGQPTETAVYVPPGQSRVVKLPRPAEALLSDRLVLRGDDHEFDNTYYVVPPRKQEVTLVYAGGDAADDAQGQQYYLRLATGGDPLRQVTFVPLEGDNAAPLRTTPPPPLAVVTRAASPALVAELKQFAERGGMVVLAPADQAAAEALPQLVDDVELLPAAAENEEAQADKFLLLGEIDFTHPLFAPFSGPRYSDFTKIHFWRQRTLKMKPEAKTHVVAKFDNAAPAILERSLGQGRVLAFASGWNPDDSQLALSTKFVPLIGGILDRACGLTEQLAGVTVDQPVPLPAARRTAAIVGKPDGKDVQVPADAASFNDTDQPGIYRAARAADEIRFAVNLAAAESNTAPLEMEQLKQLGVRLSESLTRAERLSQQRQKRDTELESQQKLWRWAIVAALGVLIFETVWAGRAARQIVQSTAAVAQESSL